jgi:hypothetical protein
MSRGHLFNGAVFAAVDRVDTSFHFHTPALHEGLPGMTLINAGRNAA